jgi:GNAT superfamily N-acetyltransferase
MVIREYGADDRAALIEQFQSLNRHEDAISGDRRTDRQGGADSLDAALRRVTDTAGRALIAERDGRLVGFLFVVVAEDAVFVREELRAHAHVAEFFVLDAERGRGVGRALLERAEQFAAARGLTRLTVSVLSGNSDALAVYSRLGFSAYSVELAKPV